MPTVKSFPSYKKRHASGNVGYRLDLGVINRKRAFQRFKSEGAAKEFRRISSAHPTSPMSFDRRSANRTASGKAKANDG